MQARPGQAEPEFQTRPSKDENLIERELNKANHEPKKGGRGTMLPPPDAESTLPSTQPGKGEHLMEKDLNKSNREPIKGGRGTMLPPPDAESTLPSTQPGRGEHLMERDLNKSNREPMKGGRGTMLPPPDAESTLPGAQPGVICGGPDDRISNTGLTSQSFGTDDKVDHHKHKYHELNLDEAQEGPDTSNQTYSGSEFRRLPSYEIENSHQDNARGMRKASFNLEQKNSQGINEQVEEDDTFTTGLMRGEAPKDDIYKHNIAPRDENVLKSASNTGSEKHKNYQAQQKVDKENVGGTYLI